MSVVGIVLNFEVAIEELVSNGYETLRKSAIVYGKKVRAIVADERRELYAKVRD